MTISQKIRDDHGTVKHFCKIVGINAGSLKVVLAGAAKSQPCVDALIKHGYLKKPSDLPQYQESKCA